MEKRYSKGDCRGIEIYLLANLQTCQLAQQTMSSDLIINHVRATAEACRKVQMPGAARDFMQNGSPARRALTNGSLNDEMKTDADPVTDSTEQSSQNENGSDNIVLQDACMLRASTKYLLGKQSDELHFLEGKIAALESLDRKNSKRNVSFWVEVFRSAGKDHVLRREGIQTIQKAWRARQCRRKLRYALVSVTQCPSCGCRAQIPQLPATKEPYFTLVPKFRCVSCRSVIVTHISEGWSSWINDVDDLIDSGDSIESMSEKDIREMCAEESNARQTIRNALVKYNVTTSDVNKAEKVLFTFTSFWKPSHVSAMLNSGIAFARGIAFRTGIQMNPNAITPEGKEEKEMEQTGKMDEKGGSDTLEATKQIEIAIKKAEYADKKASAALVAKMAAEEKADTRAEVDRKVALAIKFRAISKRVGKQKLHEKNLKLLRVALAEEQTKNKNARAELLVAEAAAVEAERRADESAEMAAAAQASVPLPPAHDPTSQDELDAQEAAALAAAKYPVGSKVLAGLPNWVQKFPGTIKVINLDGTYGVVFDVS